MGKVSNIRYKAVATQTLTLNPSPLAGDFAIVRGCGVLYLVLLTPLTGLELLWEQGAQHLDDNPEHTGTQQDENEHEHQHNSGGNEKLNHGNTSLFLFVGAGARIELAAPDNETGMLPLHHPAGFVEVPHIKSFR